MGVRFTQCLLYLGVLVATLQFAYIAQLAVQHSNASVIDDAASTEAFKERPQRAIEYDYRFPEPAEAPRGGGGPFHFEGRPAAPQRLRAVAPERPPERDSERRAEAEPERRAEPAAPAPASRIPPGTRSARVEALVHRIHGAFASIRPAGFGVRNDPNRASDATVWETFYAAVDSALGPTSEFRDLGRAADVPVRKDGSIFVSISSFRDEVCPDTLDNLWATAADPSTVFVGLVQQNCDRGQWEAFGCKTAVMPSDMKVHETDPDPDCLDRRRNQEAGKTAGLGYLRTPLSRSNRTRFP